MTHEQLITYGCVLCRDKDRNGDWKRGYWLDGVYLGNTPKLATEAILGS